MDAINRFKSANEFYFKVSLLIQKFNSCRKMKKVGVDTWKACVGLVGDTTVIYEC